MTTALLIGGLILLPVGGVFAVLRLWGRRPLRQYKPYLPYFMFGDLLKARSLDEIETGPSGPGWLGYERRGGAYVWRARRAVRIEDASAFLFSHFRARYGLDAVQNLPAEGFKLFVIGASVAQGSGSSQMETS